MAVQESITALESRARAALGTASKLSATPLNSDIDAQVAALEKDVKELEGRKQACLAAASGAAAKNSPPGKLGKRPAPPSKFDTDPKIVKSRINNMRSEWVKRKRFAMDFVENLADGLDKKPKEVVKILELDTDEAENAVMPPKYEL